MFYGLSCTQESSRNQEKAEIRKPVETTHINEHLPCSQSVTSKPAWLRMQPLPISR